jgi:hypothetical protein
MKRLIILCTIIFFSLVSSAQVTDPNTVCMPADVAKQVAEDLVVGDSAKALLDLALEELDLTNEKLNYKDSIILNSKLMEINLKNQVSNEQKQKTEYNTLYTNCKSEYTTLAKKNKTIKVKHGIISTFQLIAIGVLTVLYITK